MYIVYMYVEISVGSFTKKKLISVYTVQISKR